MATSVNSGEIQVQSGEVLAQLNNSWTNLTGTHNVTDAPDTLAGVGINSALLATLNVTDAPDTLVGVVDNSGVAALLDLIDSTDTVVATGDVLDNLIGTINVTDDPDTVVMFGDVLDNLLGVADITDDPDTVETLGVIGGLQTTLNYIDDDDTIIGIVSLPNAPRYESLDFLNIIKHLLPNAKAWRITTDKKLRQFFRGLSGSGESVKTFVDDIWFDIFPETTRNLNEWENQFGLRSVGITETQRRERLAATWQALGGQDPYYIQNVLQSNGFNVFVHEWWEPGTEPAINVSGIPTRRNPATWLRTNIFGVTYVAECGEAIAQCGEATAELGNRIEAPGYLLVNKDVPTVYSISVDPLEYPYYLYFGGETFGTLATVDPKRKDEFENLILKISPGHLWLGVLVEYA